MATADSAPGTTGAFVDAGLFTAVQSVLDARRSSTRERHNVDVPLKGRVFCAGCGRVMSPHVVHNRHHPHSGYVHYRCRSHAGGRPPCRGVSVPAEQLRLFILDIMRNAEELDADPELTPETRQAIQAAVHLIDQLRVPDPYTAVDDIIDRLVFGRESIRIAFSEAGLQRMLSAPPCEPQIPLTGRNRDVPSEPCR